MATITDDLWDIIRQLAIEMVTSRIVRAGGGSDKVDFYAEDLGHDVASQFCLWWLGTKQDRAPAPGVIRAHLWEMAGWAVSERFRSTARRARREEKYVKLAA